MKPSYARRYHPRTSVKCEGKKNCHENIFGDPEQDRFFQPSIYSTQKINRKCADCEKEEGSKNETIHRSVQLGSTAASTTSVSRFVQTLNGQGSVLPVAAKQFFQARMGYDFSHVRIHTGAEAAESAAAVHAQAYNVGEHIVFNEGKFQPETIEGKKLLAHELAHVAQQKGANAKALINRKASFIKTNPVDDLNIATNLVLAVNDQQPGYLGETDPIINSVNLLTNPQTNPLKVPSKGDMVSSPEGNHVRVKNSNLPTNETSFSMHLPTKTKDWQISEDFGKVAKAFGHRQCSTSQVRLILTGDPDSTAVYDHTKTHEQKHATQIGDAHTAIIEQFDTNLANQQVPAASEPVGKNILAQLNDALASTAWNQFVARFNKDASDFHSSAAGAKAKIGISETDTDCQWIKGRVKS